MNPAGKSSQAKTPQFAVVVASNDEEILQNCLLRSPELAGEAEVVVRRGYRSAGEAYNSGLAASTAPVIVFAHQDVFLPEGWFKALRAQVEKVCSRDPNWAVLGVFGIAVDGSETGHVYSCGLQRILGRSLREPVEVASLDEVVLIVRRSSGLAFDEKLTGFHLYGTDICQQARSKAMKSYAISAFCVHNSSGLDALPATYRQAHLYLRRKWRDHLPIRTPCMVITRWALPLWRHRLESLFARNRKSGGRCRDPLALYQRLLTEKQLAEVFSTAAECAPPA